MLKKRFSQRSGSLFWIFILSLSFSAAGIESGPSLTSLKSQSSKIIASNTTPKHQHLKKKLNKLLGSKDAVIIRDENQKLIFQKNQRKMLVPASTLKVLTSLAAIHYLGPSYRFPTDFFMDDSNNLIIKGYGDPLLISEVIKEEIAPKIKEKVTRINHLILDDSFFAKPILIPGRTKSLEPYDAPNGAFCVNFNTVFFKKEKGVYKSAEKQTPLLPYAHRKAKASGLDKGRITLVQRNNEAIQYAAELFEYFLKDAGITITGKTIHKKISIAPEKRIYRYQSRFDLSETISKLMEFSNNFIANQLFIVTGAKAYGSPGDIEKGVRAVTEFTKKRIDSKEFHVVEGSGLSRQNQVTARFMASLLDTFSPYYHLMKKEGSVYFKTGTLKGVKTKVGYILKGKKIYRFVILVNSPNKTTDPILKTIQRYL